jgi:hypothetical protein
LDILKKVRELLIDLMKPEIEKEIKDLEKDLIDTIKNNANELSKLDYSKYYFNPPVVLYEKLE